MILLLKLYFEFFKIGLFAVGGGLATIPFLYELADKTAWFTHTDIVNMFAISEITPGPIGINMATFAGYKTGGIMGAVTATAGIITPALLIIIAVSNALKKYMNNKYVISAFKGMLAAVCALITAAIIKIASASLLDLEAFKISRSFADLLHIKALIFFIILLICVRKLKGHPFFYIISAAGLGLLINFR